MDIDTPVVNDDEVLLRVHAAAVGKGDWLTVRGLPYVAACATGCGNQSTLFRASMWPGASRRSAAT
jgi:NADPH:quinone reductase-like Zn-dependent oxidoreductase